MTQTWACSRSSRASKNRPAARPTSATSRYRHDTPHTLPFVFAPGARILYGLTSTRGSTRSTFGTASTMASASRSETPSDFLRSSARSSAFTSFARTITLRRPSRPMASSAFCSAPAPIDSIAMTAPTPKIMPSIVSAVRSLCVPRLPRAVRKVSGFAFIVLRRILERQLVAGDQTARHDDASRAGRADRHDHRRELPVLLAIDELLPFLFEERLPRNREHVRLILDLENGAHARARLHQLRIAAIELHGHAEVLHRLARDAGPRDLVDRLD